MKTKYQALIVEDDPMIVEQLVGFLAKTSLFDQPYICENTMQAIITLRNQSVDLLLLDMELPDMPGLELLRLFPNHSPTIAISAHPQYAVDCYDCEVDDFMSKPLSYSRFLRGLRRTILQTASSASDAPLPLPPMSVVLPPLPTPPQAKSTPPSSVYVYLKIGRKIERFLLNEILYVEAYTIYSKLITSTGVVVINEQLSRLEQQLNRNHFMRVHKSYLVNLEQITQFTINTIWLSTYKTKVQERLKTLSIQGVA